MINKIRKIGFLLVLLILPTSVFAQYLTKADGLLKQAKTIVTNTLVPLAFTLALMFFFYGVAKYIRSAGGDKEEGRKIMWWGVIALFVISTIWGIVTFMRTELNITTTDSMKIPKIE